MLGSYWGVMRRVVGYGSKGGLRCRAALLPELLVEGVARGGGLALLFAFAFALSEFAAFPEDAGDEGFEVLRAALVDDFVGGADGGDGLEEFLEAAFGVVVGGVDLEVFEEFAGFGQDDAADGDEVAIQIHGADEGLEGIGKGAGAVAAAVGFFAAAHHEVAAEAEALGQEAEAVARDDAGADLGQVAFGKAGELIEEVLGEDELEDGVAEEFEPLVIEMVALGLVAKAGVGERFREEEGVAEFVFETLFERVHAGPCGGLCMRGVGWQLGSPWERAPARCVQFFPLLRRRDGGNGFGQMAAVTTEKEKNAWPRALTIIALALLFVGGSLLALRELRGVPGRTLDKMAEVARAFNQGTVREEFMSHATTVEGTGRFQFATLKQGEIFSREEAGSTAWGLIPLPKVVVEARAPVEYTYYLDFNAPWDFVREGSVLTVYPPAIAANTPSVDVSALQFYTMEGSVWRNEGEVRERLKESLTGALAGRARKNTALVRELGRQRLTEFVEKWLTEKFSDGGELRVKVVFPDERSLSPGEKQAL